MFALINSTAFHTRLHWPGHISNDPHAGFLWDVVLVLTFDGNVFPLKVTQVAQEHLLPITPVAD